jgi:hypothetical protein
MAAGAPRTHAILKLKAAGRTRLVVFDTQDLSLGRATENDIAVEDPEMSRRHAVFRRLREGCVVEDQGTSNGTLVNGQPAARATLRHGDVVKIGEVEITFAETTRAPSSLGAAVEYASQIKAFGTPMAGMRADGEATILGLVDAPASDDEDDFEVRPAGEFDFDLHEASRNQPAARNLDAEIASLDSDADLVIDESPRPLRPAPPSGRAGEAARDRAGRRTQAVCAAQARAVRRLGARRAGCRARACVGSARAHSRDRRAQRRAAPQARSAVRQGDRAAEPAREDQGQGSRLVARPEVALAHRIGFARLRLAARRLRRLASDRLPDLLAVRHLERVAVGVAQERPVADGRSRVGRAEIRQRSTRARVASRSTSSRLSQPTPRCAVGSSGCSTASDSISTSTNGRVLSESHSTPSRRCTICMRA